MVLQSAQLLHRHLGENLENEISRTDAFYAFHDIFQFCASTENELLNLLERQLEPTWALSLSPDASAQSPGISLGELEQNSSLLEKHIWQLDLTLAIIWRQGNPTWPRASEPANFAKAKAAAGQLEEDFQYLHLRAKNIQDRYQFTILARREREKAKPDTDNKKHSTVLLYIALLIFATTFFSMNFTELQDLSIWIYFLFATTLTIGVVTVISFWSWFTATKVKGNQTRSGNTSAPKEQGSESDIEKGGAFNRHRRNRWAARVRMALALLC